MADLSKGNCCRLVFLSLVMWVMFVALLWKSNYIPRPIHRFLDTCMGQSSSEQFLEQSLPTTFSDQRNKYIVFDCSKANGGLCGGWSDRMSGILSIFVISLLTKRRFLIYYDRPCELEKYLVPVNFDWRYNKSILVNRTSSYQDLTTRQSNKIKKYLTGNLDINTYFHHDVSFIRMNWDFTEAFRKRSNIGTEIPWITKLTLPDMYKQLFNFLFKPSPHLENALKEQNRLRRRPKLACAHIRIGKNPTMPGDGPRPKVRLEVIWNFLDKLNKDEYDIFIATDATSVKKQAKIRFSANIIDTPGKITHVDGESKCDSNMGTLKDFLDFYTLKSCDILINTHSGFGMLAAYLRETGSELYGLREGDLKPCSRYTIDNVFPGLMLAPGT